MSIRTALFVLLLAAICACSNGGGAGGNAGYNPGGGGGGTGPSPVPPDTIGIALPGGSLGVEKDPVWGTVAGYTQSAGAQVLAFAPGTKITLTNLSTQNMHTFNFVAVAGAPPAKFPSNPALSFTAQGHGQLGPGYASGVIDPGKSVTVTLSKPGTYLIGCAFHYSLGMQDVIQVSSSATPGPTATPGTGPNEATAVDPASNLTLTDQRGRAFTLASLRGAPFAMTFVSAHCTDACPLINAQFASAASRLARAGSAAHLVTVTLDPQRDSPAEMAGIARQFSADPQRWKVADGSPEAIETLMRTLGVEVIAGKDGYREAHTTFVYFFDAQGRRTQTIMASSNLADDVFEALNQ